MNDFEKLVELYLGNIPTDEEEEVVVKTIIHISPRSTCNHHKVNEQHKATIRQRLERNGIHAEDITNPEKVWKKLSSASHNARQYEAGRITAGKTRTAREKRQELLEGDDISMSEVYETLEYEELYNELKAREKLLVKEKESIYEEIACLRKEIEEFWGIAEKIDNELDDIATTAIEAGFCGNAINIKPCSSHSGLHILSGFIEGLRQALKN